MPENEQLSQDKIYDYVRSNPNNKALTNDQIDQKLINVDNSYAVYQGMKKKYAMPEYSDFVQNYIKKKSPSENASSNTSPLPVTNSQNTSTKKVPSSITTNLAASGVDAALKTGTQETPYTEAQKDIQAENKYKEYANQYKIANANSSNPLAKPEHMLKPDEWARVQNSNVMKQTNHAFITDPSYIDPKNREKYYESLPPMNPADLNYIKEEGEQAVQKQINYNYHRDLAVKEPTPDNLSAMGIDQMHVGDNATAFKTFQHIMDTYPDAPQGYQGMAALSWIHGDTGKALQFINHAVDKNPNDASSLNIRAQYLWNTGKKDEAMQDIGNAIHNATFGTKESTYAYKIRGEFKNEQGDYTGGADDVSKSEQSSNIYSSGLSGNKIISPEIKKAYTDYVKENYNLKLGEPLSEQDFANYYNKNDIGNRKLLSEDIASGAVVYKQNIQNDKEPKYTGLSGLKHPFGYLEQHAGQVGQSLGETFKGIEYITNDSFNPDKTASDVAVDALKTTESALSTSLNTYMLITPTGLGLNVAIEQGEKNKYVKKGLTAVTDYTTMLGKDLATQWGATPDVANEIGKITNTAAMLGVFHYVNKGISPLITDSKNLVNESVNSFKEGYSGIKPEDFDVKDEVKAEPVEQKLLQSGKISPIAIKEGFIPKVPKPTPQELHTEVLNDAILNNKPLSPEQTMEMADKINEQHDIEHTEQSNAAMKEWMQQKEKYIDPKFTVEEPEQITLGALPSAKMTFNKALKEEPFDTHAAILQYFSGKGKVSADWVRNNLGITESENLKQVTTEDKGHDPSDLATYISESLNRPLTPELQDEVNDKVQEILHGSRNKTHIQQQLTDYINNHNEEPVETTTYQVSRRGNNPAFSSNGKDILKTSDPVLYNKLKMAYDEQIQNFKNRKHPTEIHVQRMTPTGGVLPVYINNESFGDYREALLSGSKIMPDGTKYERQDPLKFIEGNWKSFDVAEGQQVKAIYSLIPQSDLKTGEDNFLHFSRPQNRVIRDVYGNQEGETNPSLLGLSDNIHTGAPLVNDKGEVLQGFGRSTRNLTSDYYNHLKSIEKETGVKIPDDAQEKGLMLVKKTKLSDEEAMDIMSKTTLDLHPEKLNSLLINKIKSVPQSKLDELGYIMKGNTLEDAIVKNGMPLLNWFVDNGLLNEHEANKLSVHGTPETPPTSLNTLGIKRITDLFKDVMAKDTHPKFKEYYNALPKNMQTAIDLSTPTILSLGENAPLVHIQKAVIFIGDHLLSGKGDIELHGNTVDDNLNRANDWMNDTDWGFVRILKGIHYPSDLTDFLDNYRLELEGSPVHGVEPLSGEEAMNNMMGLLKTTELHNNEHQLNNLYERAENTQSTEGSKEGNVSQRTDGNTDESRGTPTDENVRKASTPSKEIETLIDNLTGTPLKEIINESGVGIGDNLRVNGFAGYIGDFFNKNEVIRNYNQAMDGIKALDRANRRNKGSYVVNNQKLYKLYNELIKRHPEVFVQDVKDEADHWIDSRDNDMEEFNNLSPLSPSAQLLVHITDNIMHKYHETVDIAKSYRLMPESFKDNAGGYHKRLVLDYSSYGQATKKAMEAMWAGTTPTKVAQSLADYFGEEEKKGYTVLKPNYEVSKPRKYYEATSPDGQKSTIQFDDGKIHLWKYGKSEEVGRYNKEINGEIPEIERRGNVTLKDGSTYKVKQGLKRNISNDTGGKFSYIVDPILSSIESLKGVQNMLNESQLFSTIRNDKAMKPFFKPLKPDQYKQIIELKPIWDKNFTQRPEIDERLKKILGDDWSKNFLSNFDFIPKSMGLPEQFSNTMLKNDFLKSFKGALESAPNDVSKGAKAFLGANVYMKMAGTVHPINIGLLGLESMFNIDPLLYDNAKFFYHDLAWKALRNPTGKAVSQMQRSGLGVFGGFNKEQSEFVKSFVKQQMENNKDFHQSILDTYGGLSEKEWDEVLVDGGFGFKYSDIKNTPALIGEVMSKAMDKMMDFEIRHAQNFYQYSIVAREIGKKLNLKGVKSLDDLDFENPKIIQAFDDAVDEFHRIGTDYNIPSHVLTPGGFGRGLSKALGSKYSILFGGYTYSKIRSLKNMVMNVTDIGRSPSDLNEGTPKEKAQRTQEQAEQKEKNKKGLKSSLQLTAAVMLYLGWEHTRHVLNSNPKAKDVVSLPEYGNIKELASLHDMWNTLFGEKVDPAERLTDLPMASWKFIDKELTLSPLLTTPVDLAYNRDHFTGKHIYDPNGGFMNVTGHVIDHIIGGGNVINAVSHLSKGDMDNFWTDVAKITTGIRHSKYTPSQYQALDQLSIYKDLYKGDISEYMKEKGDSLKKTGIVKWMNEMQTSENGLLQTDLNMTNEIISGIKNHSYSPLALDKSKGPEEALKFWNNHLDSLEKYIKKHNEELEYDSTGAYNKYSEFQKILNEERNVSYLQKK